MARAIDVLIAGYCERRARKRLHINVLDLVAQLDIENRKIPLDALAHFAARAEFELPSLLRIKLTQIAADLSRRGQFEEQGRFVRTADVAEYLYRRQRFPDEAQFRV